MNPPSTDHIVERPGGVSGRQVLLWTVALIVAVPLLTVGTLWLAERDIDAAEHPPVWDQRADWQPMPIAGDTLERGPMSSARTGQKYIESPLVITAEQEAALRDAVALARLDADAFDTDSTREALDSLATAYPDLFYPRYLLSVWHRRAGEAQAAEAQMSAAVELAGAVIVQPVTTPDGEPAADTPVGRIDLGFDRVVADAVDDSLVLTYPHLRTDERGWAYLPVFKAIYRLGGAEPADTIRTPLPTIDHWFTFPGPLGRMPVWVTD